MNPPKNPPSNVGNPLVYPHRCTSTPPLIRPRPPRQLPPIAPAGRRTSSGFSSPPCLRPAMSRTPPAPRACRAPARIGCGSGWRARRSTGHGIARWRSMRKASPIRSPRRPPPGRRVADAWVTRPCRVAVTQQARHRRVARASPALYARIRPETGCCNGVNFPAAAWL